MKRVKQILAIVGVVFLLALYAITLVMAIVDTSNSMVFFQASVISTIIIPALLWAYSLIFRLTRKKDEEENNEE